LIHSSIFGIVNQALLVHLVDGDIIPQGNAKYDEDREHDFGGEGLHIPIEVIYEYL
jgi:hypothetical protein